MNDQNKQRTSAVVVGSGVAGLTAAYRLQQAGFDVVVLEAKDMPGGRMGDELRGSFNAYTGASGLFAFYRDMWDLLEELGIKDQLMSFPVMMGQGIADNGEKTYDLDFNRTLSMLWHQGLSLRSRLRLATLIPDFVAARRKVDPCLLHTAADFDDESLSDYLTRKVGADFVEHVVGPVYRNLWAWNIEDISRAYFLSIYAHVRGQPSYVLKGGLGLLTRTLAKRVQVRYRTRAVAIRRAGVDLKRVVEYTSPTGNGELRADIVVCAVEGFRASQLVRDQAPYERAFFFGGVPYAQYSMLHYVVKKIRKECPVPTFFARKHRNPISFMLTQAGNPQAAGDPPRIWVVVGPDRAPHYFGLNGENFEPVVRQFVREKYPLADEDILEVHEMQNDYTIAAFPTGQLRRVRTFLASQESGPKNIYYVGDYLSNATTGGACASGHRTAKQIIRDWSAGAQIAKIA